jgi:hypothetical protein
MALVSQSLKTKEFDVRMIERNIPKGTMTHQEVAKNTAKLQDESAHGEYTNTDVMHTEVVENSQLRKSLHN